MSIAEILEKLKKEGGQIVCTSCLTEIQMETARDQDRLAFDADGFGYAWFPRANIS